MISHFEPFRLSIGTEVGAPAALGLLLELVRGALKSSTAQLSLGNVSAAAEVYKYLVGRLRDLHASHTPPSERVTFLFGELSERRKHEAMSRSSLAAGSADSGPGGVPGGAGGAGNGGMGYAPMYVGLLCDIMADPEFVGTCAERSNAGGLRYTLSCCGVYTIVLCLCMYGSAVPVVFF